MPLNVNELAASTNRVDLQTVAPTQSCSMHPQLIQESLSARIYSDVPGCEKMLQFKEQGRIITGLKKTLALVDIYKFDILYGIFFPLIILTKGMLFLICLIPISQLDGVRNYLGKDKCLIAKSKNRGIASKEALEVYAQTLAKESINQHLPEGFKIKNDLSLHPQGFGICRGAVLEFVRLLSQITLPGQLPTEQEIRLIASQFSNGAPVNAVILQSLRDAIRRDAIGDGQSLHTGIAGDALALRDYNIRMHLGEVRNEKEVLAYLQEIKPGIYTMMSRYHSTLFIKIDEKQMFFFDPLHGTYAFDSLEKMRSVILHDPFFSMYRIQEVSFIDP